MRSFSFSTVALILDEVCILHNFVLLKNPSQQVPASMMSRALLQTPQLAPELLVLHLIHCIFGTTCFPHLLKVFTSNLTDLTSDLYSTAVEIVAKPTVSLLSTFIATSD